LRAGLGVQSLRLLACTFERAEDLPQEMIDVSAWTTEMLHNNYPRTSCIMTLELTKN